MKFIKIAVSFLAVTALFMGAVTAMTLTDQPIRAVSNEKKCEFVVEYKLTSAFPFTKEVVRDCRNGDETIAKIVHDRRNKVAHLIVNE